jgi:aryl-alcohol dehydrogenase-like predicted oxidoreductase
VDIPKRKLGKTGIDVTIIGLGGEGILRTYGYDREAYTLINRAIDLGITYFESARAYSGSESYYGTALRERRKEIFLASKSHERSKSGALHHLETTLRNMNTDHLDLWQVHDVRSAQEANEIFGSGGAIDAFVESREKGYVKYIGITGHHDPAIIRDCMERFDFDTVLMPLNPAEPHYRSFIDMVVPAARKKGMGIIGMKVYCRGFAARLPEYTTMEPFYRYALSHPVSTAVIGCDDTEQLAENVRFASSFEPMTKQEMQDFSAKFQPYARHLMYYKP